MTRSKGFTLIEVLVTLSIIAILAAILPITFSKKSQDIELRNAEKVIESWVESARMTARSKQTLTELVLNEEGLMVHYKKLGDELGWRTEKRRGKVSDRGGVPYSTRIYRFNTKGVCVENESPIVLSQNNEAKRFIYINSLNGVTIQEQARLHTD